MKDRIDRLQQRSEDASITEVVRRALALYEELLEIQDEGSHSSFSNRPTASTSGSVSSDGAVRASLLGLGRGP